MGSVLTDCNDSDCPAAAYVFTRDRSKIYIGGVFEKVAGVEAKNIAMFDGQNWSGVGDGIHGRVNDLAVFKKDLYVTGFFLQAGNSIITNFAKWNGILWTGVSTNGASAYCIEANNEVLYVGGAFSSFNGVPANSVVSWDGNNWRALGDGLRSGFDTRADWFALNDRND